MPNTKPIPDQALSWQYVPGLLELVDQGLEPAEIATHEFVAPQVRGAGLTGSNADLVSSDQSQLTRLFNWLRGFRLKEKLCEREPIWVPIAQVWAAPDGSAEFTYEAGVERETLAEITVFSVAAFGGASKCKLSAAVSLSAKEQGVAYDTRAYLTVYRYTRDATEESLFRVDVDCAGKVGEFQSRDLKPATRPFSSKGASEAQLRAGGYEITRLERCTKRRNATEITLREESVRSWKFELSTALPGVELPFKLGASCENTKAFETKFTLPGGRDYALCARRGEAPVVPLCVSLAR